MSLLFFSWDESYFSHAHLHMHTHFIELRAPFCSWTKVIWLYSTRACLSWEASGSRSAGCWEEHQQASDTARGWVASYQTDVYARVEIRLWVLEEPVMEIAVHRTMPAIIPESPPAWGHMHWVTSLGALSSPGAPLNSLGQQQNTRRLVFLLKKRNQDLSGLTLVQIPQLVKGCIIPLIQ